MSNPAMVQVQSTAGTVLVTVGRVDGLPLDVSDSVLLGTDLGWGIDASGVPYFETNFAVPESEHAVLTVDPTGSPVLVSGSAAGIGGESLELRAPSGRRFEHAAQSAPAREYPRQPDGHMFDHMPSPVEERAYPRQPDGRMFAPTVAAVPEREYPRQPDGRAFDHMPPAAEEREYPRDADGHLFAALPPAVPGRFYPRQEDGRLFPGSPRHSQPRDRVR